MATRKTTKAKKRSGSGFQGKTGPRARSSNRGARKKSTAQIEAEQLTPVRRTR